MNKKFLIIFSMILIFVSCKKEGVNTQDNSKPAVSHIEKLILNFEQKLNSGQKDGTVYSSDSAVWYVEALLNYSFCEAGNQCHSIVIDTLWTTVNDPGTNGFTIEQLETVFDVLEDDITENQAENKIVFAIDLYTYPAGNLTVFEARTVYATLSEPAYKAAADTSGYWYWGGNAGMCGPDSGLYVGMDAADIFTNELSSTTSDVWTSLESFYVDPNSYSFDYYDPNFPFTNYPELDSSRIFRAFSEDDELLFFCMTPAMMEYYMSSQGLRYIIADLRPAKKTFAYCNIEHGAYDNDRIFHTGTFTFGIPVN